MAELGKAENGRRWRAVLLKSLTAMISFTAACLVCELGLRVGGFSPAYLNPLGSFHESNDLVGYLGRPDFSGRFRRSDFDAIIEHNELGFRRHVYGRNGSPPAHRVFVFGDSFTWGWGVDQGQVYTDLMSRDMPHYEVLNFGLNGSGTVQQLKLFEHYAKPRLKPDDTVVVAFYKNDFSDNLTGYLRAEVEQGELRVTGPVGRFDSDCFKDRLKKNSYLFNLLAYNADCLSEVLKKRRAEQHEQDLLDLPDGGPEVQIVTEAFCRFREACQACQARFLVVYIPTQIDLGESAHADDHRLQGERTSREAFFRCAEAAGVESLDLLPYFEQSRSVDDGDRYTFAHDAHWTQRGHATAAEAISEYITTRLHRGQALNIHFR